MSETLTNAEVKEIIGRPINSLSTLERKLARALLETRAAFKALHDSAHMLDFQHCRDPKCEAAERISKWEEK